MNTLKAMLKVKLGALTVTTVTLLSFALVVPMPANAVMSAEDFIQGWENLVGHFTSDEQVSNMKPMQDNLFSVAIYATVDGDHDTKWQNRVQSKVKMTCYEAKANKRHKFKWSRSVPFFSQIGKSGRGTVCEPNGFVNIAIDPDADQGNAEWVFIGRLFPCKSKEMRFAWVTQVSDNFRHGTLRATCLNQNHHHNVPKPDNKAFHTVTNMPGQTLVWRTKPGK